MDPVSCVSCVSSCYCVNAGETHETFRQESGMRYQVSSSLILSTNRGRARALAMDRRVGRDSRNSDNALFGRTDRTTVRVFDVDDDAPGGPEVDILSVFADETRAKTQALARSS